MYPSKFHIAAAVVLLLSACGRERGANEAGALPVGGAATLDTALRRALHGAEPEGAVLIVLWTAVVPPSEKLRDLAQRWSPHGLVTLGVCVEIPSGGARDAALARVRAWEKRHTPGIPSLIFDGDAIALGHAIEGAGPRPGMVLLDAQGGRIWSGEGFAETDDLEAVLRAHLGEPNVAILDRAAPGARGASARARAERAGEQPPRAS